MRVLGSGILVAAAALAASACGSVDGSPGPYAAFLGTAPKDGVPVAYRYEPDGVIEGRRATDAGDRGLLTGFWHPDRHEDVDRFGIEVADLPTEVGNALFLEEGPPGPLVTGLVPGGPAYRAGIRRGDLVVAVDGEKAPVAAVLARRLRETEPGRPVTLRVRGAAKGDEHEFPLVARGDLDRETRASIPLVLRYRHDPAQSQFRLFFGTLFHRYAAFWATERREPALEVHWGCLFDLFEWHSTPRKRELTLLWLLTVRW